MGLLAKVMEARADKQELEIALQEAEAEIAARKAAKSGSKGK